MLLFQKEERQA